MALGIDVGVLLLVGGLAFMGWRRGFLVTAIAFLGVLLGYVGAYLLYEPAGAVLGRMFHLQPALAYGLGGAVVFFLIMAVALVIRFFVARSREDDDLEFRDALGGAAIGGLYGSALAILLVGTLNLLQALNPELNLGRSVAARIAIPICQRITEAVVRRTSENEILAQTASRFIANPVDTKRDLETVLGDERVQEMLHDPLRVKALASGDQSAVKNDETLRELAHDPEFSAAARGAGLMAEVDSAGSSAPATEQLARGLSPMAKGVDVLANDPEVQQMLQDEALLELVRSGDVGKMLTDPAFNHLAGVVLQKLREGGAPPQSPQ